MIVLEKVVFIHIHKTAGQFVNRLLLDYIPGSKQIGYHYPLKMLPGEYSQLPIIAFVRNPWDWYVSWYAFNVARPKMNPIYGILSNENTLDFNATIGRMVTLGDGSNESENIISMLTKVLPVSIVGNRVSGITKDCIGSLHNSGIGYFSWLVHRMIGAMDENTELLIGKFENLTEDLRTNLTKTGVSISTEMQNCIGSAKRINASERAPYWSYYDGKTRALVQEMDWKLIKLYGYSFSSNI